MLAYLWSRCSGGSTVANPPHIHTHILAHIHITSRVNRLIIKYDLYYILQNVFLSIHSHLNKGCSYTHYFSPKFPKSFQTLPSLLSDAMPEWAEKEVQRKTEREKERRLSSLPPSTNRPIPSLIGSRLLLLINYICSDWYTLIHSLHANIPHRRSVSIWDDAVIDVALTPEKLVCQQGAKLRQSLLALISIYSPRFYLLLFCLSLLRHTLPLPSLALWSPQTCQKFPQTFLKTVPRS